MRLKRHIFTAILLLLTLTAFAPNKRATSQTAGAVCDSVPQSLVRTYRHTDAVKSLTIDGDTLRAREIWEELIAEDSLYSPAHYYLSLIKHDSRDRQVEYAKHAYMADSTNKWYASNYAQQLLNRGRYEQALKVYRRLLELDNREISTYHAMALLYGVQGMPYSSIAILDSAELRLGRNPYLGGLKQNLLLDTRQYDRAIKEGEQLLMETPYDTEVYSSLAKAYSAAGRDSLAEATLLRAYDIDTTNLNTLAEIADYYNRRGNYSRMLDFEERIFNDARPPVDEKLRRVEQYTTNLDFYRDNYFRLGNIIVKLTLDYPTNRRVIDRYAMHLLAGGEAETALNYLRRHLDHTATLGDYINVIELEREMGDRKSVDEDLAKAMSLYGEELDLHLFAGYMAISDEHYDEALTIFRRALKIATNDAELSRIWGVIGDCYYEEGATKKAFKAYDKALEYDAKNTAVLNNYAYFLSVRGERLEQALIMSSIAIRYEERNATYLDTHAWILHLLGRNDEAKRVMRTALSIDGQRDADLLAHYGDILWALGEKFMAETYWQKAVERGYDSATMTTHIEKKKKNETVSSK